MNYTYSLSANFPNGLDPYQLHQEVKMNAVIKKNIIGVETLDDQVIIIFDDEICPKELMQLNALIIAHVPDTSKPKENYYTVYPRNDSVRTSSYKAIGSFKYGGSNSVGTIDYIETISNIDLGVTSYSVRIYDKTNNQILAEKTGMTNVVEEVQDLGEISNVPVETSVLEIQLKRTGGTEYDYAYIDSVIVYHGN